MEKAQQMASNMSMMFYASWYQEDVAPHLTREQKEKLLKHLSDYSLEHPIGQAGIEVKKEEFPELKGFAHTSSFSGLQLYVVMRELFDELHPDTLKPDYPHLPKGKKK